LVYVHYLAGKDSGYKTGPAMNKASRYGFLAPDIIAGIRAGYSGFPL